MIGQAGQWTQTPSSTPLQPKEWNAHFCITFNIWCWPDWSMDLNLIHHPSPAKNMKCSLLGYIQLLMISWAVRWTQTPSAIPLQPKKMKCSFFNHIQLLMISWAGQWTQTPSANPLQQKKMKCSFLYYIQLLMLARLVNGLKPHPPPLCSQKNEMLLLRITLNFWWLPGLSDGLKPYPPPLSSQKKWNACFWITFTSDDLPGWLMNLNFICHPSPTKKMKCSIFDYVQLLMISQAGQWTQSPSASPLQPIKWNASFWIMFTSDDQPGWLMDSNPICHPSPAKKMKCSLLDYVHFGWTARLVNGLKPHLPPLSSQ